MQKGVRRKVKINICPGDKLEISQISRNGEHGQMITRKSVYEVLQVFPCFVLCRKIRGGYRECFGWHQLREAREIA